MEKDSQVIWILLLKNISFIIRTRREKGTTGDPVSSLHFGQIIIHYELVKVAQDPQDTGGQFLWRELIFINEHDNTQGWIISVFSGLS